jgi:hypothetical protein
MKTVPLYGKRIMRSGNMGRIFNIGVANGQPPTGRNGKRRLGGGMKGEMKDEYVLNPPSSFILPPSSFHKKGPQTEAPQRQLRPGAGAGS